MLRDSPREPLAEWTLRINQVGGRSLPPTPLASAGARSYESNSQSSEPVSSTSKLVYVDAGQIPPDDIATTWNASFQQSASCSSRDESSTEDAEAESLDLRSHPRTVLQRQVHSSSPKVVRSTAVYTTKSADNLRVHGTRRPKAPFDIFAKCVISAWALTPKPEDDSIKIRTYAR